MFTDHGDHQVPEPYEAMDDYYGGPEDHYGPLATPGEAHAEWHLNSGVPMGMPGCPQDACHPHEEEYGVFETVSGVRCGNKRSHGEARVHHASAAEVRSCYEMWGAFTAPAPAPVEDSNACSGGKCSDIYSLCTRHQGQYQARFGRASNE